MCVGPPRAKTGCGLFLWRSAVTVSQTPAVRGAPRCVPRASERLLHARSGCAWARGLAQDSCWRHFWSGDLDGAVTGRGVVRTSGNQIASVSCIPRIEWHLCRVFLKSNHTIALRRVLVGTAVPLLGLLASQPPLLPADVFPRCGDPKLRVRVGQCFVSHE